MTSSEIINFYHSVDTETLSKKANLVCESIYGNKVYLRGLIEFSNYCQCDCLYCGIRKSNPHVQRYRLPQQSILEIVKAGYKRGLKTFVLQSGEDSYYTTKMLTEIIEKIKLLTNNEAAVTLSCGMKSKNDYQSIE